MVDVIGDVHDPLATEPDAIADAVTGQLDKHFSLPTRSHSPDRSLFRKVHREDVAVSIASWPFDARRELLGLGQR